ncbi:hypothetical protein HAX54_040742 [Datura stramonium]|uniref:Uncharacterized protein n=1 Tax=Datura stramonium TaxID=4076 RepID=A0ABS8VT71_DATST|nr:hypothetical protein [Datura stramonium]
MVGILRSTSFFTWSSLVTSMNRFSIPSMMHSPISGTISGAEAGTHSYTSTFFSDYMLRSFPKVGSYPIPKSLLLLANPKAPPWSRTSVSQQLWWSLRIWGGTIVPHVIFFIQHYHIDSVVPKVRQWVVIYIWR